MTARKMLTYFKSSLKDEIESMEQSINDKETKIKQLEFELALYKNNLKDEVAFTENLRNMHNEFVKKLEEYN